MKYIANIITKSKIDDNDFILKSNSIDKVDLNIPTLIIGWKNVKKIYPEQDILNKHIKDNIYWTFSNREKRCEYEEDLSKFKLLVMENLEKMTNYKFFNFITSSENKKKCFFSFMEKGGKYVYINSRFAYIYDGKSTVGVSLTDIEYLYGDKKWFVEKIKSYKNNIFISEIDFISYNNLFIIKNNVKIVPLLKYLKSI